jgi:NAD-dependent dihydropyrimidine dehydrogenase PreA subunit
MDKSCVEQCPVEAFYQGPDQVFISPDECIDCGACVAVCPVNAIYAADDVPANMKSFVDKAAKAFTAGGLEKAQPKKK